MVIHSYMVPANSNNEHFNADCDFAVVTLTPDLLKLLPKLQKIWAATQKQVKSLALLEVTDWGASFIKRSTAEELLGEKVFDEMESNYQEKPFLIPYRADYKLEAIEAHADYLVVTGRGVWWKAYPKHADISVESGQIDWAWFARCAYCGLSKEEHVKGKCLFSPTNYKAQHAKTEGATHNRRVRKKQPRKRSLQEVQEADPRA